MNRKQNRRSTVASHKQADPRPAPMDMRTSCTDVTGNADDRLDQGMVDFGIASVFGQFEPRPLILVSISGRSRSIDETHEEGMRALENVRQESDIGSAPAPKLSRRTRYRIERSPSTFMERRFRVRFR